MSKNKKIDFILLLTYIYIFLPILLFLSMWLKPIYALIMSILVIAGVYFCYQNDEHVFSFEKNKDNLVKLGLVFILIVLLVLTSGTGSSIPQYPDHLYRNGLFKMLIDHDWPVKLSYDNQTKGITYYIGFWLPAALLGKVTSSYGMGLLGLQIWSIIGLFLVYFYICERKGKIRLWFFIAFLLFGGADYLGFLFIGKMFDQVGNSVEWWAINYNYPGVFTSIFWVYNQCIYGWLIHSLIMRQKNNKNIMFIWSASLLNCSYPAIGMMPFAIYRALKNIDVKNKLEKFKSAVVDCFSWQAAIGVLISLITGIYILGNISVSNSLNSQDISNNLLSTSPYLIGINEGLINKTFGAYHWTTELYKYLWFVLLEFGLYFILIYKKQKDNPLYWLTLVVLLACPLIKVGGWIDFCMRGSIPGLFVLYDLVTDTLEDYYLSKQYVLLGLIISIFVLTGICCYNTLLGVMQPMAELTWNEQTVTADMFDESYIFNANNFFSTTNSLFFKYLAK